IKDFNAGRLAGAVLITPVLNYWWAGLPTNLTNEVFYQQKLQDQWTLRVARYIPLLTYWWNTQAWFPASSLIADSVDLLSLQDKELLPTSMINFLTQQRFINFLMGLPQAQVRQQREHETVHRDLILAFGSWEFSPLDLENPFPNYEDSVVHIWQGDEDLIVPFKGQRYIAQKLPWIQ
ncbi:hypothetical protein CR513_57672, partial [Mucuna pruriens]